MNTPELMDKVVALCKRRGFIFQSSEIYGGLNGAWDYGPMGSELKRNVKNAWWKAVVQSRDDMVGLDASILMHPKTWEASGHINNFSDPFVKCPACGKFYRQDKVWDEIWNCAWSKSLIKIMAGDKDTKHLFHWAKGPGKSLAPNLSLVKEPEVTISFLVDLHNFYDGVNLNFQGFMKRMACEQNGTERTPCPACGGPLPEIGVAANLMLKTVLGPVEESGEKVFLRPETAQGIFVNFTNVIDSTHKKLPFGIAQIGKSFRNEITPGNFTFRTREFEQMEIEYFTLPDRAPACYREWISARHQWYLDLGIRPENLKLREHGQDELAHYAAGCTDIEYLFPFGWSELEGIANRTDYDLKQHAQFSGKKLIYKDPVTNQEFYPFVIEPSGGCDRGTLAFLVDAYHEEMVNDGVRVVMKFHPALAPVKVAIFPLLKKNADLVSLAKTLKSDLKKEWNCVYDDTGAIGKLYRRQDEIGTPFCVTVDVQSLEDRQVTVRERDTMQQTRVPVENLKVYLRERLA
ncbi:MAG: glycine--tRNA ligase [Candidatus Omnitrophota bacterium]